MLSTFSAGRIAAVTLLLNSFNILCANAVAESQVESIRDVKKILVKKAGEFKSKILPISCCLDVSPYESQAIHEQANFYSLTNAI